VCANGHPDPHGSLKVRDSQRLEQLIDPWILGSVVPKRQVDRQEQQSLR
jgi:hypothetical protein